MIACPVTWHRLARALPELVLSYCSLFTLALPRCLECALADVNLALYASGAAHCRSMHPKTCSSSQLCLLQHFADSMWQVHRLIVMVAGL